MAASLFGTGGSVNVNVNGTLVPQSFVATDGQTLFNLSGWTYTPGTNSLLVFINGQKQVVGRDFTETSTSSFTLIEGCVAGDFVDIIGFPEVTLTATNSASVNFGSNYSLQNYVSDSILNVKAYPYLAKGDGVTDDTSAIQSAITYLGTIGGGTLFFPKGEYLCNRLIIRSSNITLSGEGWKSWLHWTGVPGTGIFGGTQGFITAYPTDASYPGTPGTQLKNVCIEKLRITGQAEAAYTTGRQGIQFENVLEGKITGCLIENFGAESLVIDASLGGSVAITAKENEISGGFNYWNPGNSPGCVFEGNYCHDQLGQGCEIRGSGNKVINNYFKNSGTITLLSDYTSTGRGGIIFSHNTLESCAKLELNTQTAAQITNVIVANNTFWKGTGTYALLVRGGSNVNCRNSVHNNIITEQVSGGGIELTGGYGGVVTNNIIFPGVSGSQTSGIVGDINAKCFVHNNFVVGHSVADININNAIGYLGPNITGVMSALKRKSKIHEETLSGSTGNYTLVTDSVLDLATNTTVGLNATAGMLMLNIRSTSTTTGRNLLSSFVAHVSGGGHHTSISNTGGPTPGTSLNVVNTLLTGTSGAAGSISASVVSGTAGAWKIQVENRSGADINIGWHILGLTA